MHRYPSRNYASNAVELKWCGHAALCIQMQEDAIKLSASDLTENMRSALTFRLRKKELINRTLAKIVDELRKHTGQRQ